MKNFLDKKYLDTLFGSDEAFGIRFVDEETGEEITSGSGMSVFPDGSDAITCTNYAEQIKNLLTDHIVQIVGFANIHNPGCAVVVEDWHPGGHDFAIVDHRWLVDPWARLVAGTREQIVYDLQEEEDIASVAMIYGSPLRWSRSGSYFADRSEDRKSWDRFGLENLIQFAEQYYSSLGIFPENKNDCKETKNFAQLHYMKISCDFFAEKVKPEKIEKFTLSNLSEFIKNMKYHFQDNNISKESYREFLLHFILLQESVKTHIGKNHEITKDLQSIKKEIEEQLAKEECQELARK